MRPVLLLVDDNDEILEFLEHELCENTSDMVGYASQTNFGRNFLKQFGMTPSDYLTMKEAEKNK